MENLPFPGCSCDVVMVHAALHHLPDPVSVIQEMVRCLKPKGLLIIGHEPNRILLKPIRVVAGALRLTERHTQDKFSMADDVAEGFTRQQLERVLARLGIRIVRIVPVWYTTGFLYNFPVLTDKVFHQRIEPSPSLRCFGLWIDRLLAKIPILSQCCFFLCIVGIKELDNHL